MAREPLIGLLAACALAAAVTPASATPEEFVIDGAHTFPTFAVVHLGISTQRGRFERATGKIVVDREAQSRWTTFISDEVNIAIQIEAVKVEAPVEPPVGG